MQTVCCKDNLLDETKHVVRNDSVMLVESTERLNFLDLSNHAVTECNE